MTTQEQIQFIREKAIKANPDILKLKFGCLVCTEDNMIHFVLGKEAYSEAIYTVIHSNDFAKLHKYRLTPSKYAIIGRDIRLADVLYIVNTIDYLQKDNVVCMWNLLKDSLDEQSPDTIDFIYNLLK